MYRSKGAGHSIFSVPFPAPLAFIEADRETMQRMCQERNLPLFYYEASMGLWSRVKNAYQCQIYVHGAARYMAICLNLTIKWAGPAWTNFEWCTIQMLRRDWPYLTTEELQHEELDMCRLLNWEFF